MAGLVNAPAPSARQPKNPMDPAQVMAAMHVNPKQKVQLDRIVAAGLRVMFDPKTHKLMLQSMQAQGPVEQKLADGVVRLMGMLWSESKASLPPELLIPAAMVLLAHAADFLNKTGQPVTPEQFGKANELAIDMILKQVGLSSDKIAAKAGGAKTAAPPAAMPAQPQGGA